MIRIALAVAAAYPLALAVPLAAQSAAAAPITLGEWLANDRETARLAPGPARDAAIAALHETVVAALKAGRAAQEAKLAAGQTRDACLPPPGSGASVTAQAIGTWLHNRPSHEHGDTIEQVLARFLAERYPCR